MMLGHMTRRQAMAAGCAGLLHAKGRKQSRISLEGYIWQNLAAREKRPLLDMLEHLYAAAARAGFQNIELNHGFFTPALKDRVIELTSANHLMMPSVYVGGGMHEPALAEKTIARALEIGTICKEFGCTAIVNNPDSKPKNALKSDEELATQAKWVNEMGRVLFAKDLELRLHHHTAEMMENAREWRHLLRNTDPKYVSLCIDIEHVQHGGADPDALLREAGKRVSEVHLRNKTGDTPLQAFEVGDIDYGKIAATLRDLKLKPLIVIELAYHSDTAITRDFTENLRLSNVYAEKLFGS
jgi:inosose dehydratase